MSQTTDFANTPRYLLKSGNQAIYPTINFEDPDTNCICVYGFSEKPIYDKFIWSTSQLLTPYPLVQRYLSNQLGQSASTHTSGNCLMLVILDATDHFQPVLSATTMKSVLKALQDDSIHVPVEFELVFDPETSGYNITGKSNFTQKTGMPLIVK
jgi:hypothetical protein